MTSCITGVASLVKPEPDVVGVYKVHGPLDNRYLVEMPAHTHLKPTYTVQALTLTYHSLRSSRRSIHNGCPKKSLERLSVRLWKETHRKTGRREQRKHRKTLLGASCGRIVYGGSGLQAKTQ